MIPPSRPLACFLVLSFFFQLAPLFFVHAQDKSPRPRWVDKVPRNPKFLYYVGRASNAKTEKQGIEMAAQDAYEQAIRENFGITTRISKESTETLQSTKYAKSFRELSGEVRIVGFAQEQIHREKNDDKTLNVWVLFRYPKIEIPKEKARLRKVALEKKKTVFSVQGRRGDAAKGTLEVITEPEDASVAIDGEPWGRTPLRLIGKLPSGRHTLSLTKTNYENITRDILIIPGKVQSVEEKLVRGVGALKLTSEPSHAHVAINGKRIGLTPTDFIELESGIPHKVEISHPETHPQILAIELGQREEKVQQLELNYRPSYLRLNIPPGANAFLDEVLIARDELKNVRITPNEEYQLEIRKEGYETHSQEILLKGGETKNLSINLVRDSTYFRRKEGASLAPSDKKWGRTFYAGIKRRVGGIGVNSLQGVLRFTPSTVSMGNVMGLGIKASAGTGSNEKHKLSFLKLGAQVSYHPYAVQIGLQPLKGFFGIASLELIKGQAEDALGRSGVNFQTQGLALGGGYDFENFSLSLERNFYREIPANSLYFDLSDDFEVGVHFKRGF